MTRAGGGHRSIAAPGDGSVVPGANGGRYFLRGSHIYASAVREVLEAKLLHDVTSLPLTFSQFRILKCVTGDGSHHVGEVASWLGVSPPAATRNVDKLVRLGLLVRRRSRGDRRAALIALSPRSRRLMSRYERRTAERLDPLLREFSPDEVARFTGLLERFAVSLLRHGEAMRGACLRCAAYFQDGCPVADAMGQCPCRGGRWARTSRGVGGRGHPSAVERGSRNPPTRVGSGREEARRESPPARRRAPTTRSKE